MKAIKKFQFIRYANFSQQKHDSNLIAKDYELFKLNTQAKTESIYEAYKKHGKAIFY
jgi:hypothetical protein